MNKSNNIGIELSSTGINKNDYITRSNWHSGSFRELNCTKTLDGYYGAVSDFVKREGKPIGKTMLLVRNCRAQEVNSRNWGASWTTNIQVCHNTADRYKSYHILMTLVTPDELAVHYDAGEDVSFYEEEYVLDIKNHKNPILYFEQYCECDGRMDWWVLRSEDLRIIEGYKESHPELFQELCRQDVYRHYLSCVEKCEREKTETIKAMKLIRENKVFGVSIDFKINCLAPKSGVVTRSDIMNVLQQLGVTDGCEAVLKDGLIPGTKRLTIMHGSKEIGFYISSRLAKVLSRDWPNIAPAIAC